MEGLVRFAKRTERDAPLFFVGREPLIERLREGADWLRECAAEKAQSPGGALVQGAPGAGKSSLLNHLRVLWGPDENLPDVVEIQGDALLSTRAFVETLGEQLPYLSLDRFRETLSSGTEVGGRVLGVGGGARAGVSLTPPSATLGALRSCFPRDLRDRPPVVMVVDEVQNITPDMGRILWQVHQGGDHLPVFSVLAGLGSSREHLRGLGISRYVADCDVDLGSLEPGEPAEAAWRMFDAFRVRGTTEAKARWARRVEELSSWWPQHLHTGLSALASALSQRGGDLGSVDGDMVASRAHALRRASYVRRLSASMRRARKLLAALMSSVEYPSAEDDVLETIDRLATRYRMPDGMTSAGFLDHLIAQGALQNDADGRLVCPIPSFREFLIRQAP